MANWSLQNRFEADRDSFSNAEREEILRRFEEQRHLLQQNPYDTAAYIETAQCQIEAGLHADALSTLKAAVDRCPPSRDLYMAYVDTLQRCNRVEEAIAVAERGLLALPGDRYLRIARGLSLPILYDTPEEVGRYRSRFEAELNEICGETALDTAAGRAAALQAAASWVNFYLGYQGRNDCALQRRYGRLLHRVMAANYPAWAAPLEMPPRKRGERLRVGYVSSHFRYHTVMKNHLGWLREHDKSRIEVCTYHTGADADAITREAAGYSARFSHTPGDFEGALEAIARDRLHILVYLDLGMKPITSLLAALRLAPVQCVAWGHPVTSGLETMDYFISCAAMEPDGAAEHYCERLICLPGIGICYRKPVIPRAVLSKKRGDFGLEAGATVYLSCQSFYKYLPEHDHIFAEIAAKTPNAQFVFLAYNKMISADFLNRLERAFAAVGLAAGRHCVMLPAMDQFDYWNLNLLCDVYLDTLSWSGGTTTLEAIACGLPVVTLPGEWMRSRHSYGILSQLGVTETIAHDKREYVDIAVRLGADREWRENVVAQMRERFENLFNDKTCVRALEAFYERAVAEAGPSGTGTGQPR